jgi:cardiolipin synthase A/B
MKTIYLTFPVLRGARRFFIEKGPRWSLIEHLLLDAVCRKARTVSELSMQSGLPRRVVVEAFIRLMRAGWVEMTVVGNGLVFGGTTSGVEQAPGDQLQAATVVQPKYRGFAIEQITGGVFRSRELDVRPQSRLPMNTDDQIVVHLPGSISHSEGELSEVFTAIEGEDELIVGVDKSSNDKLVERFAVVTVQDELIEGLPARASIGLRNLILAKAKEVASALETTARPKAHAEPLSPGETDIGVEGSWQSTDALYDHDDLIIDGEAHKTAFERLLRNATERLIIHSTFITDARAQAVMPMLLAAAAKGVSIDIFWGQDDVGTSTSSSRAAAQMLQSLVAQEGRSDSIVVHPFTTNSHAKVAVADNGRGRWIALLGSCNWLASDFTSFEASARLRDPVLVGQLIRRLAGLARGRPGIWHDVAVEMTVLGRKVERMPRGNGRTVPMRLLFSSDHAKLALEARNRAEKRIFVLSHRLGIAGRPVTLLPMLAAVKMKNVEARAYYGRTTGPLSGVEGAGMTREFAAEGMTVQPVHRPRLHAKVLGWDDNALAVTSLNWLSADPPDSEPYREIGILIEAPRVADNFIRIFENARFG